MNSRRKKGGSPSRKDGNRDLREPRHAGSPDADTPPLLDANRVRLAFERAAVGVATVALDGRWLSVNPKLCAIVGYTPEELLARTFQDITHPEDLDADLEHVRALLAGEDDTYAMEKRYVRKDGSIVWILLTVALARTAAGKPDFFVSVIEDISARRASDDALRRAHLQQQAILDNIPDLAWLKDEQSRFIAVNAAFAASCGVRASDLVGKTDLDIWPTPLAERYRADDAEVMRLGVRKRVVEPLVAADGTQSWIETCKTSIHAADGVVVGTAGIARDITERRRAEETIRSANEELERRVAERTAELRRANAALAEREALLDAFFESGTSLRGIVELEGNDAVLVSLNRATARLLGDDAPMKNRRASELRGPKDLFVSMVSQSRESLRLQTPVSFEAMWPRPEGTITLACMVAPIGRSAEGRERFAWTGQDITERRLLEEQLRQAQKLEGIGRLAGGVAHDFNNLLTAIGGFAALARQSLLEEHPARADIKEIEAACERASALTRQLLAFARKQVLEPRAIDLSEVTRGVERLLRRLIGEDVSLVTNLGKGGSTVVWADSGQIEQVLVNLAVNARDAMPDGGTVTIATQRVTIDAAHAAQHHGVAPGEYALLSVGDSGTGISPEVRRHLFEPFFTTKEFGKGTGLGLATCYGIIKKAGGWIWVDSRQGHGTTFRIYLPRLRSTDEVDADQIGVASLS